MALGDGVERVVGKLIVVAVVAEGRGTLGKIAEIGLVLLFKNGVLRGDAIGYGLEVLGEDGANEDEKKKQDLVDTHGVSRVPERKTRPHEGIGFSCASLKREFPMAPELARMELAFVRVDEGGGISGS